MSEASDASISHSPPMNSINAIHEQEPAVKPQEAGKIDLTLKAIGDAPIMKRTKWAVAHNRTIGWVATFIRKYLKLHDADTMYLYVNQTYAPAPDELLENLYNCFGSDHSLVLHYSKTQAWG